MERKNEVEAYRGFREKLTLVLCLLLGQFAFASGASMLVPEVESWFDLSFARHTGFSTAFGGGLLMLVSVAVLFIALRSKRRD